jgi:hypothetical protein
MPSLRVNAHRWYVLPVRSFGGLDGTLGHQMQKRKLKNSNFGLD